MQFLSKVAASQRYGTTAATFMRYTAERYVLHYYKPAGTVVRTPVGEPIISLALRPGAPHPKACLLLCHALLSEPFVTSQALRPGTPQQKARLLPAVLPVCSVHCVVCSVLQFPYFCALCLFSDSCSSVS